MEIMDDFYWRNCGLNFAKIEAILTILHTGGKVAIKGLKFALIQDKRQPNSFILLILISNHLLVIDLPSKSL